MLIEFDSKTKEEKQLIIDYLLSGSLAALERAASNPQPVTECLQAMLSVVETEGLNKAPGQACAIVLAAVIEIWCKDISPEIFIAKLQQYFEAKPAAKEVV